MILVTGVNGQLGFDVIKELRLRNIECIGTTRKELDVTDKNEVYDYITKLKPEGVIHCAAYTSVDKAEDEEELCRRVNVNGTENIAKACKEIDSKMIYISTDYIYSGTGNTPFAEEGDIKPQSIYGKTKYEGELKVQEILDKYFIVRISWVFGSNGNNFVKTMIKLAKEKKSINVVCDQIGSPTYTADLASLLCDMIMSEKYGVYNATNEGYCSWAEFAEEIMRQAKLDCKINFIKTSEYPYKAVRPFNSKMSKGKLIKSGFKTLPRWNDALKRYFYVGEKVHGI